MALALKAKGIRKIEYLSRALETQSSLGIDGDEKLIDIYSHLAYEYRKLGDAETSLEMILAAEQRLGRLRGTVHEATLLHNKTLLLIDLDRREEAERTELRALDIFGALPPHLVDGNVLRNIGTSLSLIAGIQWILDKEDEALRNSLKAESCFRQVQPTESRLNNLVLLAQLYENRGERQEWKKYLLLCHDIAEKEFPQSEHHATALVALAWTYCSEDRLEDAQEFIDKATAIPRSSEISSRLLHTRGLLELKRGDVARAKELFQEADRLMPATLENLNDRAIVYLMIQDPETAIETFRQAESLASSEEDRLFIQNNLARTLIAANYIEEGNHLLVKVGPVVRKMIPKHILANAQNGKVRFHGMWVLLGSD